MVRDDAAALHGRRVQPRHVVRAGDDTVRLLEGLGHVARARRCAHHHVGADPLVQRRRVGSRLASVDQRGERLVIHGDGIEGVACGVAVVSDDDRHGLARVAHAVQGEHGMLGYGSLAHALASYSADVPHPADEVGARQDCQDARHRSRGRRVDGAYARVGVGAAQHRRMHHAVELQVVDERTVPPQQTVVLEARERPAAIRGHQATVRTASARALRVSSRERCSR